MAEAEYQHECSRAELLGLPKPSWDEFASGNKTSEFTTHESDEVSVEEGQEIDSRKERFDRLGGGLGELNSILSSTQKKLNNFKTVCGSFSNILKHHMGSKKEVGIGNNSGAVESSGGGNFSMASEEKDNVEVASLNSAQNYQKIDKHSELAKLDSLISKAERAELSLSSQNKQMKRFLN